MTRRRAAVSAALAVACTSCSLVYPYDRGNENDPERCVDGTDNDLDGLRDCLDPDCWAFAQCDEDQSDSACFDGVDNDQDGLDDAFDPACWGARPAELIRCGTIRGGRTDLLDALWQAPIRRGEAGELHVPAGDPFVGWSEIVTGGRAGTTLSARVDLPLESELELWLRTTDAARAVDTYYVVRLTRSMGLAAPTLRASLWVETEEERSPAHEPPACDGSACVDWPGDMDGVVDVQMGFDDDDRFVSVSIPGTGVALTVEPRDLAPAPTLRVGLVARSTTPGATVRVLELWVDRPDYHPCNDLEGEPIPVPFDGGMAEGTIHTLAASPWQYCALFEQSVGSQVVVLRAPRDIPDNVATSERPPGFRLENVEPWIVRGANRALVDPQFDWDERLGSFAGAAVVLDDGRPTGEVALFRSEDCVEWDYVGEPAVGERFAFDELRGGILGYSVDEDTGVHRLIIVDPLPGSASDGFYAEWSSLDGGSSTFTRDEVSLGAWNFTLPGRTGARWRRPKTHYWTIRGELLRSFANDGYVELDIDRGAKPRLASPSGIPGTFDFSYVDQAVLWMPDLVESDGRRWWGVVMYTARECLHCPSRLGWLQFSPSGRQRIDLGRTFRDE